ncbi:MAG: HAD-IIA family hydrolase [Gammaproteobacteria bacterium]
MNILASLAHPPQRKQKENIASAWDTLAQASHLLLDLDGTLVRQNEAIDGSAELLARFEGRFAIVSNNSTHTAQGLSLRLRRLGLRVPPARIVLAGEGAVDLLARQQPGAHVMVVGSAALQRLAAGRGLRPVDTGADVVLLALDLRFSHARLSAVVHELRGGARLLVANADTSHPGPQGRLVPETGALLAAVVAASGVRPWRVVGKPEPLLFEQGLRCLGADPARTLVVGDNPATDAAGAARLGLACLLVGDAPGAHAASVAQLAAPPAAPVQLSSA